MAQSFTPWMDNEAVARGEIYHHGPPMFIRDQMEGRRLRTAMDPSAEYPLGYTDTVGVTSRRDRLNTPPRSELNSGSFQRGVHAYTKVPTENYLWPIEFHLMSGIENQTTGRRFVSPVLRMFEQRLVNDGKPGPSITTDEVDPVAAHQMMLDRGRPPWH